MSRTEPALVSMQPEWREAVGRLLAEAFHAKLGRLTGLGVDRLARAFSVVEEGTGERRILILVDGGLAGTLLLRRYPARDNRLLIADGGMAWMRLARSIGLWQAAAMSLALSLLSHRPRAGEWYIGDVAVNATYRGQGIGALLIGEVQRLAAAERVRLTLHVAAGNPGARRLYERLGFRVAHTSISRVSRWLLGEERWLYMSWAAEVKGRG
ncbi:N-acetyltransferase [Paenibacillus sp. 598K]|uniref:GNAT family N-acetyltransferase n=1 Tax=Paenibacillus sp. 598K TaxID=1117987 RepID=UPI000FFA43D3|nr:GNAT family N-acetyltransferase [Paenibacillus sp. 598K]GBF77786.1 N-acetyltransferase [Paenibacillus sp. 598K]